MVSTPKSVNIMNTIWTECAKPPEKLQVHMFFFNSIGTAYPAKSRSKVLFSIERYHQWSNYLSQDRFRSVQNPTYICRILLDNIRYSITL